MSSILKIALCPAPFQHRKKKPDRKNDKKVTSPESHLQHVLPDTFIPSLVEPQPQRPSSTSPRSSMSSGSPHQPLRQAISNQHDFRAVVSHGSSYHIRGDEQSTGSRHTQSSGYQSDYHSGYVTEGDGAFETQLLHRATKEFPANLRMTAIRDYSPCCNEELAVRKGQRVKVLYRNHDWVFAVTKHGQSGYLPYSYVRPSRKYNGYQSEPEIAKIDDPYISGYDTDMASISPRYPYPPSSRAITTRTYRPDAPQSYTINTGGCRRVGSGSPIQAQVDVFDTGYMSAIEGPTYRSAHHMVPSSRYRPSSTKPSVDSFQKDFIEELVVIHDFIAKEEDEVFVSKGERVKVLNADDPNWLWVVTTHTGEEGFIPRSCCTLGNHPSLSSPEFQSRTRSSRQPPVDGSSRRQHPVHHYSRHYAHHKNMRLQAKDRFKQLAMIRSNQDPTTMDKEEIKRIGTKLIVLMDYEAVSEDELSVEFAESLIADVLSQTGVDRIWAYCPRTDTCGFIPMSMVVPPVV